MIVLAPDFMTKICKKAAQHFHCAVSKVFDRVKSVALWSANIRKLAKDHKATVPQLVDYIPEIVFFSPDVGSQKPKGVWILHKCG